MASFEAHGEQCVKEMGERATTMCLIGGENVWLVCRENNACK